MLYTLAKSLMFQFDPETSHNIALHSMNIAALVGANKLLGAEKISEPVNVMGIDFPNPVGLAAGLDKNAIAVDGLAAMGFGFIEVGTVTPRPQAGNPTPRLFRLPAQQAIINRMGFNNAGVDKLLYNLSRANFQGITGINIGKNKDTPNAKAEQDYLYCLRKVYARASYITVNISSPNTPDLRELQYGEQLNILLDALKSEQLKLEKYHKRYVPIAIKIAPDMNDEELISIADRLKHYEVDAVIATNTTLARDGVEDLEYANEAGGLSGAPVRLRATKIIGLLAEQLANRIPIIGVGGITEGFDAAEKIEAGASLVQLYTGFIYQGPSLIADSVKAIKQFKQYDMDI